MRAGLPEPGDVLAAAAILAGAATLTPLVVSSALDGVLAGEGFLKPEVLQRTGSFKFRGAYHRLAKLTPDQRQAGIVAYSSGNHAQGAALAAKVLGMPALIVMPKDAPAIKLANTKAYGAEVVLYDRATEHREVIAAKIASERKAVVVPAFDDPFIIAGQGTIGLELADQIGDFDQVLVPCSGGGLASGIALGLRARGHRAKVFIVEPRDFDDFGRSLASGHIETNAATTGSICDALMSRHPGDLTFPVGQAHFAGALKVSDDEVRAAVAFAFEHFKLVVEPGGAAALAAALFAKVPTRGVKTAIILSGGNVDPAMMAACLAQGPGLFPGPSDR